MSYYPHTEPVRHESTANPDCYGCRVLLWQITPRLGGVPHKERIMCRRFRQVIWLAKARHLGT